MIDCQHCGHDRQWHPRAKRCEAPGCTCAHFAVSRVSSRTEDSTDQDVSAAA